MTAQAASLSNYDNSIDGTYKTSENLDNQSIGNLENFYDKQDSSQEIEQTLNPDQNISVV